MKDGCAAGASEGTDDMTERETEPLTEKIYQRQPYQKEWKSEILRTEGNSVVLRSTIFAPEAGGQPSDRGMLGGYEVRHVREENGIIYHELADSEKTGQVQISLAAGQTVEMKIDWERRFDHMQNHLGEHILSGLFKSEYDADNKGFHMGEDIATFDIDRKEITAQMLRNIEHKANRAVYDAIPVEVSFVESAEDARRYPLRKPLSVDEDILIVTVKGVDCVACCCPHPSDTSQIGIIKLLRTEKYKGMTRIYFKCGMRALLDYEQKHEVVTALGEKYSADEFSLLKKESIAEAKREEMRRELNRLKDRLAEIRASELLSGAETCVTGEMEEEGTDDLKRIAKKVTAKTDLPVILASVKDRCVFLTHSGKSALRCGALVKEFAPGSGGRGGGSDTQAQVVFRDEEAMRNFVQIAVSSVSRIPETKMQKSEGPAKQEGADDGRRKERK